MRDPSPYPGVQVRPVAREPGFPHELRVGLNRLDRRKYDVYRVRLAEGEATPDTEKPGDVQGWTVDAAFRLWSPSLPRESSGRIA